MSLMMTVLMVLYNDSSYDTEAAPSLLETAHLGRRFFMY